MTYHEECQQSLLQLYLPPDSSKNFEQCFLLWVYLDFHVLQIEKQFVCNKYDCRVQHVFKNGHLDNNDLIRVRYPLKVFFHTVLIIEIGLDSPNHYSRIKKL